jgi:hypothetical protein
MASKTVQVKLTTACYVDGFPRKGGEIVELPELADDGQPFAVSFGEIVGVAETQAAPEPAAEDHDEDL